MPDRYEILAARAFPGRSTLVFPAVTVEVPDICIFSNVQAFDPAFGGHLARDVYAARTVFCDPVMLVELPPGAIVDGRTYLTLANGRWLRDQCHPALLGDLDGVEALCNGGAFAFWAGLSVRDINAPCLLVARYGETTWGHWLCELLPRVIAAEQVAPGHFTFAIPAFAASDPYETAFRLNALSSLALYGIGPDRLLQMSPSYLYRFAALAVITPAWTEPAMMHPDIVDSMRTIVDQGRFPERIFLVRDAATGRTVVNQRELQAAAARRGYTSVSLAELSFADQVRCFAGASRIVSVLGSDLAGVIYAPDGVGVLSLAPGKWGDRFFYALMQMRDGRYADLRGTPAGAGPLHRTPFTVELEAFEEALDAVG